MCKRTWIVLGLMVLIFAGIGARIYQLSQTPMLAASEQQSSRRYTIASARGTIYDRYLQPLVNADSHIAACIAPFADCLSVVSGNLPEQEADTLLTSLQNRQPVMTDLSFWLPPTTGIAQTEAPVRYGDASLARHLVGYVDSTMQGVSGVEAGYNEQLKSYAGDAYAVYQVDAFGQVVEGEEAVLTNTLAICKGGVALTLDAQVQAVVEAAAAGLIDRGAVVISDPQTGEILASVSLPTYDQNDVAASLDTAGSPLLDRTLTNYNCGSVFKVVTAAAALENGISSKQTYTCTGSYKVGNVEFHCHNPLGEGKQTMEQAFANSCNSYFIQLADTVGAKALYDMADAMGFTDSLTLADGVKTARSLLPSRDTLVSPAAVANLCIGQGELLATPVHINAMCAAVANGGIWYEPTVIKGNVDENGTLTQEEAKEGIRVFSEETAAKLTNMMQMVVADGTGTKAQPHSGIAAGKTGTAETGWVENGEEVVQSWFCGFYPAEQPQYVITVLSENGGTTDKTAAPVFAKIVDGLLTAGLVENTQDFY